MLPLKMKRRKLTELDKDIIGNKCSNCGCDKDLEYHHIIPLACGGNDINSNMVCLCGKCHSIIHGLQKDGYNLAHSILIKNGIKRARHKGTVLGRPKTGVPKLFKDEYVKFLNKEGVYSNCSTSHFAFLNDIAISTYYKYISVLKNDPVWKELIEAKLD